MSHGYILAHTGRHFVQHFFIVRINFNLHSRRDARPSLNFSFKNIYQCIPTTKQYHSQGGFVSYIKKKVCFCREAEACPSFYCREIISVKSLMECLF